MLLGCLRENFGVNDCCVGSFSSSHVLVLMMLCNALALLMPCMVHNEKGDQMVAAVAEAAKVY